MAVAIAIDLGGTHCRFGVVLGNGEISLSEKVRLPDYRDRSTPQNTLDAIVSEVAAYTCRIEKEIQADTPVVLAFPGPVDEHGYILSAPGLLGPLTGPFDFGAELSRRLGRRVSLLNDVTAAAWYFGGRTNVNRFLVVTVSTGIGSKLYDRVHPLHVIVSPAYSGEIGHVVVDESLDAPICDCGRRGHLGAISSGRGVERFAANRARQNPGMFTESLCVTKYEATAESLRNELHIIPAAIEGDPWAQDVISDSMRPLAKVIATITLGAGIEKVFVFGGFAQALGTLYRKHLDSHLARYLDYSPFAEQLPKFVEIMDHEKEPCLAGVGIFASRRPKGVQ